MSSPLVYKVYARPKGATSRIYLAAFAGAADAYAFAIAKSADFVAPAPAVTVTGWDGRVWWKFQDGVEIKPKPGNLVR
jgi:hypothetical protein